ncbi:lipoprotein [Pseudomonas laurentiana]|uniref:DUF6279 family lipoprotein n=1 Tax=Pseudomonas laurentiana TaxID=2364649 RepID=UPI001987EEB9|nr:DUF6279 family lipoprotein [Pseudomonas laurentiana]GGU79778.1 lipoprotein [Pseudomonas laurentiana]
MYAHLSKYLRALLLPVLCGVLLVACNRIDLAYRNLDILVPWSLNDYLDMSREQKAWLKQRLKTHLSWHCRTQLPGYLEWLDRVKTMVASNQVSEVQLQARTNEIKHAINDVAKQITPSAVELLRALDDEQVRAMRETFAEDIREKQQIYASTPFDKQVAQRTRRMEKRLTPWLGELNSQQQLRVMQWANSLGARGNAWITNRAQWQAQFSAAVEQRRSATFPEHLERLLIDRESVWTPEYRQAYQQNEAATRSLLVDLMAQSSPYQRQHLEKKLAQVQQDFSQLKCLKAGA